MKHSFGLVARLTRHDPNKTRYLSWRVRDHGPIWPGGPDLLYQGLLGLRSAGDDHGANLNLFEGPFPFRDVRVTPTFTALLVKEANGKPAIYVCANRELYKGESVGWKHSVRVKPPVDNLSSLPSLEERLLRLGRFDIAGR